MSNRLYIGDAHIENSIWDWVLPTTATVKQIADVAERACSTVNFTVYVDSGARQVAVALYGILAVEYAWALDYGRVYWKTPTTLSPVDDSSLDCVSKIEEAEQHRKNGVFS